MNAQIFNILKGDMSLVGFETGTAGDRSPV